MYDIFITCMVTFALSSAWLYSPGYIQLIRERWIDYFEKKNSFWKYLGICQLCSGFWFGIISSTIQLNINQFTVLNIKQVIIFALIASVFSWTFGSLVNALQCIAAFLEASYNRNYGNDDDNNKSK